MTTAIAGTDERVASARPTIAVDGQESASLSDGLLSMFVAEDEQGLYRCEATFGNWGAVKGDVGFLYFDRTILDFGKAWQIKLGSGAAARAVFDGLITGLEAQFPQGQAPRITVLAEDRLQDLRMTRRTRTFERTSDADVFTRIAGEHGLTPNIDMTGPVHPVLVQVNRSDLDLLRERARAGDAEVWVDGTKLFAQSRSKRNGGTLVLTYNGALREFSVLADLAHQRTSVRAGGWDVSAKQPLTYEATDADLGGELDGNLSGSSILRSALGTHADALVHTVPFTQAEVRASAQSSFRLAARRFLTGHGIADPDPRLAVGSYVELRGLGPLFSGKYYLSAVQHLFDGTHGLRTEFVAQRAGLGQVS